MSPLIWILIFTILAGAGGIGAASLILLLPEDVRRRILPVTLGFAVGALLGASCLGLLPHAIDEAGSGGVRSVCLSLLAGLLAFVLLERLLLWRHGHHHDHTSHPHGKTPGETSGVLILVGDSVHNFIDGVLIASAFLSDVRLGVLASVAVVAHEIPQEIADFTILLHAGFKRSRALLLNLASNMTAVAGGVLAYFALGAMQAALPFILAFTAAGFLYIALADLIPALHHETNPRATVLLLLMIALGVGAIALAEGVMH